MKTLTALAIVVIALAVIGLAIWALRLKKWSEVLNEKACEISCKANELASKAEALRDAGDALVADRKTLVERYKEIQPFLGKDVLRINERFVVTEEAMLRYKSEAALYNVAKNRLAVTIGNDIVRNLEPFGIADLKENSLPIYEYRLKIVVDE